MPNRFPGMAVELGCAEKGCSQSLFDGVFAAGGLTLSQVSVMTGLEPYLIQNWIKRGFVAPPVKRLYSRQQLARIALINMLREALQIEKICSLIGILDRGTASPEDDLIGDEELYHRYVDMIAEGGIDLDDPLSVSAAAERACGDYTERVAGARKQLARILALMLYAHAAARLRRRAEGLFSELN